MWISEEYRIAHAGYNWRDGVKALVLYVILLAALVVIAARSGA